MHQANDFLVLLLLYTNGHGPDNRFKPEKTDGSHLHFIDKSGEITHSVQLTRKTSRPVDQSSSLQRMNVKQTNNLDVSYCIVLFIYLYIIFTYLSSGCIQMFWKLYFSIRNILLILLQEVKYSFEQDCESNLIFTLLRSLVLMFLLSHFPLNFGQLKSCVSIKIHFRQRGLSKFLKIFIPMINRTKADDIKYMQADSICDFYRSYKTSYSRKHAYSNKPLTYLVYPVSTINLLASFRPLVYMEMPNSIFFITLSSNGFFYPGNGASVTCISCENLVDIVRFASDPSSAIYHKPGCAFIKAVESEDTNSISAQEGRQSQQSQLQNGIPQSMIDSENSITLSGLSQNSHSTSPGVQLDQTLAPVSTPTLTLPTLGLPAYPIFCSTDKRTESFAGWTKNSIVTSTALVQAGFFYAGYSDCVRCFQCGLGLRSWKPGDDIYVEHQRFRPSCVYLQTLLRNKPQGRAENSPLAEARANSNQEQTSLGTNNTDNGTSHVSNNSSNNSMPNGLGSSVSNSNLRPTDNIAHTRLSSQQANSQNVISPSSFDLEMENPHLSTTPPSESRSTCDVVSSLLQRENQALKELMLCKSCKVSPVQDVFLPCGEMYTCKDCSNKFTHCPSCGKRILGTVTVFFA